MGNGLKIASVNDILATRARATFSYRINFDTVNYDNLPKMKEWCEVNYDNLPKMKEWCEVNCQGLWRSEQYYALYFQFEQERDATMFMLRWGTAQGNKLK